VSAYVVTTIDAVPSVDDEGVDWKPIQHYFQLTTFGINVYRATAVGIQVIGDHDERAGRHEEVYVVLDGSVRFTVGDDEFVCRRGKSRRGQGSSRSPRCGGGDGARRGPRRREPRSRPFRNDVAAGTLSRCPTYDDDNPSS
jgi:hypothetical protein